MNQKEFIKSIVEIAKEREIELSQAIVKEILDVIEVARNNAILEGKTVKVLGCKFQQIEKPETSGISKLHGKETSWTKPAHKTVKVSFMKKKRESLEIEI